MTDVHSHILPLLDDGSSSVKMSLEMLKESKRQGIDTVFSTSHCYLRTESDIDVFLKKRNESFAVLNEEIEKNPQLYPKIRLGSEVRIENDVSGFERLEKLKIEGTDYILIEMPFDEWRSGIFDALYSMTLKGMKPIMAHIERFFFHKKDFDILRDIDVIYQINAESLMNSFSKKIVPYLFKNKMVHLIGSDMHNTSSRKQCMREALDMLSIEYGTECRDYLIRNSEAVTANSEVNSLSFKKAGLFGQRKNKRNLSSEKY